VESRLLLNVVITEGTSILKLLPREDKTLLIGRDALLILDLSLDVVNGIGGLDIKGDGLTSQSLYEDLREVATREDIYTTKMRHV
jgi:hypothetical protein